MKVEKMFGSLMVLAAASISPLALRAGEDPYITGAEYEVSGEWLIVKSGSGTLVRQFKVEGTTATRVKIEEGAELKIGIDGAPFSPSAVLHIYGALDVNGHDLTALRIDNAIDFVKAETDPTDTGSLRRKPGLVVNTSQNPATVKLVSSGKTDFYGAFEERPGKINLETSNTPFNMYSPFAEKPISSFSVKDTSCMRSETVAHRFKFVFQPPADSQNPICIGEIELTCQGRTVPASNAKATVEVESSSYRLSYLLDGVASTCWKAKTPGAQTITVTLATPSQVDGLRITPGPAENRPSGWDVYAYRDSFGSVLVDSRRDIEWYSRKDRHTTANLRFNADVRLGSPFGENTEITLGGSADPALIVCGNDPFRIGKLAGRGNILMEHGSIVELGDISGYAGVLGAIGATWNKLGRVRLTGRGGSEQKVSVAPGQNISIENGDHQAISVLLDDSRAGEHLFGKLADGEKGQLGLVKRAEGERVVETEDASYTGATVVHGGTLTVAKRRPFTARYIRIVPIATYGNGGDYPWGMNEFALLDANGNKVAWPEGTEAIKPANASGLNIANLIDGDIATRMLMGKYNGGTVGLPPVTIDTKEGVTFSSYTWYTPHQRIEDTYRTPVKWQVEVSDSAQEGSWVLCCSGEQAWSKEDADDASSGIENSAFTDRTGRVRGPFAAGASQSVASGLQTLSPVFMAAAGERDTHAKLKSRYFMLQVRETASPESFQDSYGCELAEICLLKDGKRIDWPQGTVVTSAGNVSANSRLENLVDNVVWDADGAANDNPNTPAPGRTFFTEVPTCVIVDAGEEVEFDSYSFVTTSPYGAYAARLPKAWSFSVSSDGALANYETIDTVGAYTPGTDYAITQAYQQLGPFELASRFPALSCPAGNSIGDFSPVSVGEGAVLRLDTPYEKFGSLSGLGTFDLGWNCVGEINAFENATFSGSVSGKGTLVISGTATQSFDGADLSGVEKLELNGGVFAGSASFGGRDAMVSFDGGATQAMLSGIDRLVVFGEVRYAAPAVGENADSFSVVLFKANAIDSGSKALLAAGEICGDFRKNWKYSVAVTDTAVVLSGHKRGTVVIVR